jgi:sortase A
MADKQLKRKLGWLEIGLYAGGVALLAVFFYVRGDADRMRKEGLRVFEQVAVHAELQPTATPSVPSLDTSREQPVTRAMQPNQDLWAEKRIREYEESLRQAGDPPLAVLTIDKLDIAVPVYNGTDDFNLNRGVGRVKGTAWIDTDGNLGIAGHRDGFFRPLKDIQKGDTIDLQTARGTVTYEVSSITIVDPDDVSVLAPTQERTITLVTCYPFYYVGHAPKRYIVTATAEHFLAKT